MTVYSYLIEHMRRMQKISLKIYETGFLIFL